MKDYEKTFDEKYGEIRDYLGRKGFMPTGRADPHLARWVSDIRRIHREQTLQDDHGKLLDELPGWEWKGPKDTAHAVADHIEAFKKRNGRLPQRGNNDSERALSDELDYYEANAAAGPYDRSPGYTRIFKERGLLFHRTAEGKSHSVTGKIVVEDAADPNRRGYYLHPTRSDGSDKMPLFQSGFEARIRPIRLHMSQDDIERHRALTQEHSVTLVLARAGRNANAYEDGKIAEWESVRVNRREPDARTDTIVFLVNRLQDRRVTGRPAYTHGNVQSGAISREDVATSFSDHSEEVSIGHIIDLADRARTDAAKGNQSRPAQILLDDSPGFSWVDPDAPQSTLATAVDGLVKRHGMDILTSEKARQGDNGRANTLRIVDQIMRTQIRDPRHQEDLAQLRERGHLQHLSVYMALANKRAAEQLSPEHEHPAPKARQMER